MAAAYSRVWSRLTEIGQPVVIGSGQGRGHVRVLDQMKALGKPSGVEKCLVHAHGVHIGQSDLRVRRAGVFGMGSIGVKVADLLPSHARLPDGMARDVRIHGVAEHLAVDLEIRAVLAFLAPQGCFAERAELRLQVVLPDRPRLDHMAVAIKDGKRPGHARSPSTAWPLTRCAPSP